MRQKILSAVLIAYKYLVVQYYAFFECLVLDIESAQCSHWEHKIVFEYQ